MDGRWIFAALCRGALLACAVSAGCGEPPDISNRNGGRIDVIGHGGAGLRSRSNPLVENSLSSLRLALDGWRTDGVEVDVQMTADGELVLFHDKRLETKTDCAGVIHDRNLADLRRCRLEHTFRFGHSDDRILTLAEALAFVAQRTPRPSVYLDVKVVPGKRGLRPRFDADFLTALERDLEAFDAYSWVTLESNRLLLLRAARRRLGGRMRILYDAGTLRDAFHHTEKLGLDGFVIAQQKISRRQVQTAHERGLWVVVMNVASAVSARHAVELSPDAVQADNIRVMQEALAY